MNPTSHGEDKISQTLATLSESLYPALTPSTLALMKVLNDLQEPEAKRFLEQQSLAWLSRSINTVITALSRPPAESPLSLQHRLLEKLSDGDPTHAVWSALEKAKHVARKRLTELSCRILIGESPSNLTERIRFGAKNGIIVKCPGIVTACSLAARADSSSFKEVVSGSSYPPTLVGGAILHALPRQNRLAASPAFRQFLNGELTEGRIGIIAAVARKLSQSPKKLHSINEWHLEMARNWVNPHMPLWLATTTAISDLLSHTCEVNDGTDDAVKKERSRHLSPASRPPITQVKAYKDGKVTLTLTVKGITWTEDLPMDSP